MSKTQRAVVSSHFNRWMYLFIPVCVSGLVVFASALSWFSSGDNFLYDHLLLFKKTHQSQDVVIVEIDQQSIHEFGRWPWSRKIHSKLIDQLVSADAVFFDVIFAEENTSDPDGDNQLIRSVKNHGRVVLPIHMELLRHNGQLIEVPPMSRLYQVAAGLGHVHVACDDKGVCRSFYLKQGVGEAYWPHASLELFNLLKMNSSKNVFSSKINAILALDDVLIESPEIYVDDSEKVEDTSQIGGDDRAIKSDSNFMLLHRRGEMYFPFFNASDRYRKISYMDVISGGYPTDFFSNKVVFVGATATGLGDYFSTPQGLLPGVILNAIAFDALRNNELIRHYRGGWIPIISGFLVLVIALLLGRLSPFRFVVSVFFVAMLLLFLSFVALNYFHFWVVLSPVLFGLIVYYPLWNWFKLQMALTFLKRSLNDFERSATINEITPIFASSFSQKIKSVSSSDSIEVVTNTIERLQRAIEQAEYNRQLVSQSLSSLQDAVVLLDEDLRLVLSNELARVWFSGLDNYSSSLTTVENNQRSDFVTLFNDDNRQLIEPAILSAVKGDVVKSFSLLLEESSAVSRYVLVNINKIELLDLCFSSEDIGEKKAFIICVFTDVTAIKAAEQSKLDTLNFLSHDLRSPMVSVLAVIDMHLYKQKQQDRCYSKTHSNVADDVDVFQRIRGYVKKNLDYSESLLQLSRAESLVADNFGLIDFHCVMENALYQVNVIAERRGITIDFHSVEDDIWLYGNTDLVERALVNLFSNAIKYSHDGGGINCSVALEGESIHVSIKDAGVGMSDEFLTKIFSRFARSGDDPEKRGIGLGLFFVKTVVDKHKGSIAVTSCLGEGSCFTITLPCAHVDDAV